MYSTQTRIDVGAECQHNMRLSSVWIARGLGFSQLPNTLSNYVQGVSYMLYTIHTIYITILVGLRPSKSSTPSYFFTIQTLRLSVPLDKVSLRRWHSGQIKSTREPRLVREIFIALFSWVCLWHSWLWPLSEWPVERKIDTLFTFARVYPGKLLRQFGFQL